jgi:hypothetical protein
MSDTYKIGFGDTAKQLALNFKRNGKVLPHSLVQSAKVRIQTPGGMQERTLVKDLTVDGRWTYRFVLADFTPLVAGEYDFQAEGTITDGTKAKIPTEGKYKLIVDPVLS